MEWGDPGEEEAIRSKGLGWEVGELMSGWAAGTTGVIPRGYIYHLRPTLVPSLSSPIFGYPFSLCSQYVGRAGQRQPAADPGVGELEGRWLRETRLIWSRCKVFWTLITV
jgi:hypothetical protein